jgi:uncharacterized protein
MDDLEARLARIVRATPWLMQALAIVRGVAIPDGYIAAGAIRDTVWDAVVEHREEKRSSDVDVVYFDAFDAFDAERNWCRVLAREVPSIRWEVTNQAMVHRWQSQVLGRQVLAYPSVSAAIRVWPETATAVAVRILWDEQLEIVAPCGLADLFNGIVRRNPATPDVKAFARRVEQKQWQRRWPGLRILEG